MEKLSKPIDRGAFAPGSVMRDLDAPRKPAQHALISRALPVDRDCVEAGTVPLISAITVTLNAGRTLERTIDSVQRQTYLAAEHIIVAGGSMDGTLHIFSTRLRP